MYTFTLLHHAVSFTPAFFFLDQNLAEENQLINILDGKHCLLHSVAGKILLMRQEWWQHQREYKVDTEDGKERDEEIRKRKGGNAEGSKDRDAKRRLRKKRLKGRNVKRDWLRGIQQSLTWPPNSIERGFNSTKSPKAVILSKCKNTIHSKVTDLSK